MSFKTIQHWCIYRDRQKQKLKTQGLSVSLSIDQRKSRCFFVLQMLNQGIKSVVISYTLRIVRDHTSLCCACLRFQLFLNHFIVFSRVLLVDREESRPAEWVAQKFLGAFSSVFPTMSIPIKAVARAMVVNTLKDGEKKVEILENKAICNLEKIGDKK